MSSKYLAIDFTGTYSNLMEFFGSKGWTFEIKNIAPQRIFVKVPDDLADEVKFFESPAEDPSETRMTKVSFITGEEYSTTAENGFEIINPEKKLVQEPIVTMVTEEVKPMVNKPVICPPRKDIDKVEEVKYSFNSSHGEDVKDSIARALNDTVLPSKSPLDAQDPFAYVTSRSYLSSFAMASTVLLFVVALLD